MKKGYVYIFLTTILFSSMEVALKMVSNEFNPIQITFLRFFIGSLVLLPFAIKGLKNKKISLNAKDLVFFALTGFLCVVLSMILYQLALLYAPASMIAILLSSISVFSVIFAFLFLGEKIYLYTVISMIINILGIMVIINPQQMSGSAEGIILILLSSAVFAAYGVLGRKRIPYFGGTLLTCFSFLLGSLELFFLILCSHTDLISSFLLQNDMNMFANVPVLSGIQAHNLPNLVFIGVFVTGLGYLFYFLGMEETSTATGSIVFFIKPALAPILASFILQERVTISMIAGIFLIVIGSSISFAWEQKTQKTENLQEL